MKSETINCLSIGAGSEQLHAIRAARRMEFKVLAVDRQADAPGMAEADVAFVISTAHADEVATLAREQNVRLVLPVPIGRFLTTIGYVNDQLGLRGVTEAAARNCVDKRLAHQVLRAAGVPVADQVSLTDSTPPSQFAGHPVILKPRFGSGSKDVRVYRTAQEAVAAGTGTVEDMLIEALIEGEEYGVDGAVFDGAVSVWLVRRKRVTGGAFRADMAYFAVTNFPETVVLTITRAVEAMGLSDCLFHADVIVNATGVAHVIELSGRPSGMNISAKLLPLATGVDIVSAAIAHLSGQTSFPQVPQNIRPAALIYFPLPAGKVTSVGKVEAPASWPGVIELHSPVRVGDMLDEPSACADFLARGYALISAPDETALQALGDEIVAHMTKEIKIGN